MENFKVICKECGNEDVDISIVEYNKTMPHVLMFECKNCEIKEEMEC